MGRLIDGLAGDHGFEIAGIVTSRTSSDLLARRYGSLDVAFDFTNAAAFLQNLPALCRLGGHLVVGTTGWNHEEARVREAVVESRLGAVVAANFSLGASVLEALAGSCTAILQPYPDYGAFVHEAHHAAKKDAPSGTAKLLAGAMERSGLGRPIHVSATRAGHFPGTHTIGFDGPSETITLTHTVRDRRTFAEGALHAARWVQGRTGWFTMRDVLTSMNVPGRAGER